MTAEDKNTKQNADQPSKSKEQPSNQNDKLTKDDDNSIGYNGEKKTALDLEIERELLEMMENEDPEPEKQKRFKNCRYPICICDCHSSHYTFY